MLKQRTTKATNAAIKAPRYCAILQEALGFTLLEVMVSLVILAIGVLGIVALQMSTYKSLQTSHNFANAAALAGDMADRMLANRDVIESYIHSEAPDIYKKCSKEEACDQDDLVNYDLAQWQDMVQGGLVNGTRPGSLPAGQGAVMTFDVGTAFDFSIVVRWDDDLSGSTGTDCADLIGGTQAPKDLDCYVLNMRLPPTPGILVAPS